MREKGKEWPWAKSPNRQVEVPGELIGAERSKETKGECRAWHVNETVRYLVWQVHRIRSVPKLKNMPRKVGR